MIPREVVEIGIVHLHSGQKVAIVVQRFMVVLYDISPHFSLTTDLIYGFLFKQN